MLKKIMLLTGGIFLALFVVIQFIPLAGGKTNPPISAEPQWDRAETKVLAQRSCYDCHSNETKWPWYSNVAPVSWLVINDTNEGRSALNFSQWGRGEQEALEAAETVQEGRMPPRLYLLTHAEARLNSAEKTQLVTGLQKTFSVSGESEEGADPD
jgi:mono/diheme cytochrome c family protein